MRRLLFLFTLTAILFGCKKKETKVHSLVINCYETQTGAPIQATVQILKFPEPFDYYNPFPYTIEKTFSTKADGTATIDVPIEEGNIYYVKVFRPEYTPYGYPIEANSQLVQMRYLNTNNTQTIFNAGFEPYTSFQLSAKNINCTGPTDSVWIDVTGYTVTGFGDIPIFEAYGCADTSFNYQKRLENAVYTQSDTQLTFDITTKKGGVVNQYSEIHNLTLGNTPDQIVIEY